MKKLSGALTALVTPFTNDDALDVAALKKIVAHQVEGGIDGLVIAGTTGESPTITSDEKKQAVGVVRELVGSELPIILGTGTNNTKASIAATKDAKALGVDAALVVCPYYNKPNQEGLYQHFLAIYEATGMPLIAYNVPGRTASDLHPETIGRLLEKGAICAVKDATANLQRAIENWDVVKDAKDFSFLSGDDFTVLPFVACGGDGVVSVVSNIVPGDMAKLVRASAKGDFETARPLQKKLIDLSRALFSVSSPIPIKALMALAGLCSSRLRLPLVEADEKTVATVRSAAQAYGGIL